MAKLIKKGSFLVFEDIVHNVKVPEPFTKFGFRITPNNNTVTININSREYFDSDISNLEDENGTPFTEQTLLDFIATFNVGGGGGTVTLQQAYDNGASIVNVTGKPFTVSGNEVTNIQNIQGSVTSVLEVSASRSSFEIIDSNDNSGSGSSWTPTRFSFGVSDGTNDVGISASRDNLGNYKIIVIDTINQKGLEGLADFSENYNDLTYVQKKWVVNRQTLFQATKDTIQTIPNGSYTKVSNYNTVEFEESSYTFNPITGDLIINDSGIYEISYHVVGEDQQNNRVSLNTILQKNTVEISNSFDSQYMARNATFDKGSCQINNLLQSFVATDVLSLHALKQGSNANIIQARLTVKKIK